MKTTKRATQQLIASTSLAVLALVSFTAPAHANDGTGEASKDGAPSISMQPESGELQEITVTANRYKTDLQQTPIAITAFEGSALRDQGITQARDLTSRVPNLTAPLTI